MAGIVRVLAKQGPEQQGEPVERPERGEGGSVVFCSLPKRQYQQRPNSQGPKRGELIVEGARPAKQPITVGRRRVAPQGKVTVGKAAPFAEIGPAIGLPDKQQAG